MAAQPYPDMTVASPSPTSSRGGGEPGADEEVDDPMLLIKNLDTGLEMRIGDFDRLTHIAADEPPPQEGPAGSSAANKAGLMKGTKALRNWTQNQAKKAQAATKKAVSSVKEVAREAANEVQAVQAVLVKHKLVLEPSPRSGVLAHFAGSSSGGGGGGEGQHQHQQHSPLPIFGDLLRRPHHGGEASSPNPAAAAAAAHAAHSDEQQASGSLASVSVPASSDAEAAALPLTAGAGALQLPAPTTPLAGDTAAAAAAVQQPSVVVPALVRLATHKSSRRPYEAAVLAQVLEGGAGVVWAVAVSNDGCFLATAGQDAVVRVWQLTSSSKHTRDTWVYASPPAEKAAAGTDGARSSGGGSSSSGNSGGSNSSSTAHQQQQQPDEAAAEGCSQPGSPSLQQQRQHPQQQQQQQPGGGSSGDSSDGGSISSSRHGPAHHDLHHHHQQQQQQPGGQPPQVEWGAYFSRAPVRAYAGHAEDVLCLSWSCAGGFLLSGSLDKTVRLWHLSQPGCLREFAHSDFVTSVQFHPADAQRFVSGSLDGKIWLWSVASGAPLSVVALHQDMVTSVAFSLSGSRVMAGTLRGRVRFYDVLGGAAGGGGEGKKAKLEYVAQVDVRNTRGQHASGKKVTGIAAVPGCPQSFVITTNDSRLRLLEGYGQVAKFKGHRNATTQSRAAVSPGGTQIACGSDDGCVFLWQASPGGGGGAGSGGGGGGSWGGKPGGGGAAGAGGGGGGGGGSGGGTERARAMAAAAAAQYQQLVGKNAAYQAFQSLEPGLPVTAVAFVPQAAAGLPRASVLSGGAGQSPTTQQLQGGGAIVVSAGASTTGNSSGAGSTASAAAEALVDAQGRRLVVQQLVVSAGFGGGIRVHELIAPPDAAGGGGGGGGGLQQQHQGVGAVLHE